jgi:small basic protein
VTDLYLAAVVTLGGRIFLNLSVIRRQLLERRLVRDQK